MALPRDEPYRSHSRTPADRLRAVPRRLPQTWCLIRVGLALLLRGWMRIFHRLTIVGRENLPARGSFVLVANHASHMDTLALLATVPLSRLSATYPAAAADYFFGGAARSVFMALVLNALPFQRRQHLRQSLMICRKLLADEGNVLILYPEGTRSTDGRIQPFRPGIGMVLAGSSVAGVPCYLEGCGGALPKGCWMPRPRRIRVVIGAPRNYAWAAPDKAGVVAVSRDLEAAVRALKPSAVPARAGSATPVPDFGTGPVPMWAQIQ